MPAVVIESDGMVSTPVVPPAEQGAASKWFVLWTRSHCEELVFNQLAAKGFGLFLPRIEIWSRRAGIRHLIQVPMFPGYVFLQDGLEKPRYAEVQKARGLVSVLGTPGEGPAAIAGTEIEAIQKIVRGRVPAVPHPYLREGQRVRIIRGPLTDVEGILVGCKSNKGLLVLAIDMLRRSVAVEVDCTLVVAA